MSNETLPDDPYILLSFINTKLRDRYASLDELCNDMQLDKDQLIQKLQLVGFQYNPIANKFW